MRPLLLLTLLSFIISTPVVFAEQQSGDKYFGEGSQLSSLTCNDILNLETTEASDHFGFQVPSISDIYDLQVITASGLQSFGALFTFGNLPVFYSSYWPLSQFCKWTAGSLRPKPDGSIKITGQMVANNGDSEFFTGDIIPANVPGFPEVDGYWYAIQLDPSSSLIYWGVYNLRDSNSWQCLEEQNFESQLQYNNSAPTTMNISKGRLKDKQRKAERLLVSGKQLTKIK